ncbi:nuclear RNA polymerase C1 [Corchorus olitorius]|uniref:Nuclear RNA polymerase C1 n=1 Tax=Corchorus olitorius TaxID=93759 RepID=A0A1R3IDS9_9ROSI|nr:nuclear RNA polymerase C1 [Corchorus olitorius]
MEAGEDREAEVTAWSQGVATKDNVLRSGNKIWKAKVVTEDLEKSKQVVGNTEIHDQVVGDSAFAVKLDKSVKGKSVVEDSLHMEAESESDMSLKGMDSKLLQVFFLGVKSEKFVQSHILDWGIDAMCGIGQERAQVRFQQDWLMVC